MNEWMGMDWKQWFWLESLYLNEVWQWRRQCVNSLSQVANVKMFMSHVCHLCCQLAVSSILLCRTSQAPSEWVQSIDAQPISDLFRDAKSGLGWAAQGHSPSSLKAAVLLFWLCALGCPGERRMFSRALLSWLSSRMSLYIAAFLRPWLVSQFLLPHWMMLPPPPCFSLWILQTDVWHSDQRYQSLSQSLSQRILFFMD